MKATPHPSLGLPNHPFWEFSLTLYHNASVKEACLALQNHCGMNVNVILFCCWLASTGRGSLHKAELQQALNAVSKWDHEITQVLRQLRHNLTKHTTTQLPIKKLYQAVLDHELAAEHIEQLMLAGTLNRPSHPHLASLIKLQAAIESLTTYTHLVTSRFTEDDRMMMCQLLTEVFPDVARNEILQQYRFFSLS